MAAILLGTWGVMSIGWIGMCFFKMRGQQFFGDRLASDEFVAAAALPPIIVLVLGIAAFYGLRLLFGRLPLSRSRPG
jgi:hypothetical protein